MALIFWQWETSRGSCLIFILDKPDRASRPYAAILVARLYTVSGPVTRIKQINQIEFFRKSIFSNFLEKNTGSGGHRTPATGKGEEGAKTPSGLSAPSVSRFLTRKTAPRAQKMRHRHRLA
jgi:hypothetical protein